MKKFIITLLCSLINFVLLGNDIAVFKQTPNGMAIVRPAKKTVEIIPLFADKRADFELRDTYKNVISLIECYYKAKYYKATFLNIKTGEVKEFNPSDFDLHGYNVMVITHYKNDSWILNLENFGLKDKVMLYDTKKGKIIDNNFQQKEVILYSTYKEYVEWYRPYLTQKSVTKIFGTPTLSFPLHDPLKFMILIEGDYCLLKEKEKLYLYQDNNKKLKLLYNLSHVGQIINFDWSLPSIAIKKIGKIETTDFSNKLTNDRRLLLISSATPKEVNKYVASLMTKNLMPEFISQISGNNLTYFLNKNLKKQDNSYLLEGTYNIKDEKKLQKVFLKIKLQMVNGNLYCKKFLIKFDD